MARIQPRSRRLLTAVLTTAVACALATPLSAKADDRRGPDVPLPSVTGPVQVTEQSRPFIDRLGPPRVAMQKAGYTETEYFVSGTANVYTWAQNQPVVRTPDAPYTTRIVVRAPSKPHKFSGAVWVEPLNPTLGIDLDRTWQLHHDQILRDGDAWVGITSKPNTIAALKKYDPDRYAPLSMANPLPPEQQTCGLLPGQPGYNANTSKQTENGLIWDIMSQVGALMKSSGRANPLPAPASVVFGEGWSQTGGFANRYLSTFGPLSSFQGKPIYDGWLVGGPTGPTAINQCENVSNAADPRQQIRASDGVPVITLRTESDSWFFPYRRPDSDSPTDRYRLYEIAGVSHDTASIYENFAPDADVVRAGVTPVTTAVCGFTPPSGPSDFPYEYFFNAAAQNLKQWRLGVTPPPGQRYAYSGSVIQRDQYSNALGGLRSPYVDVPIASYGLPPGGACPYIGTRTPFSDATLEALYPAKGRYVSAVVKQVNALVKDRYLLQSDSSRITREAAHADLP